MAKVLEDSAVFHRSTRLISAAGAVLALPLAFVSGRAPSQQLAVSFETAPDKRNPAKFCAVAVQVGSRGINDHADTQ